MINILELITAITIYSYANYDKKITFIFLLFDFDSN
jgi:hypothetical protein